MAALSLGYSRVSTAGRQKHDLQVDALEAAGITRRWEDTCSGTVDPLDRPGFARLLDAARPGDEVVIWRLDRLGRSALSVLRTVEVLEQRGLSLRSLNDGIQTGGPTGRLLLTVLAGVAALDREIILERSREGIAAARARGKHLGRPHSLSSSQQAHVRELRGQGQSLQAIADAVGTSKSTIIRTLRPRA